VGIAQVQNHIFGGACAPVAEDAFEQFPATFEVVVEAATGDLQFLGQGVDPHSVDAAGNQDFLCRMNPIFPREVGA
jgi:hypothetical protein